MAEKLDMTSKNWLNENTQFIAERFPNCVTETEDGLKVDFELLQQELSGDEVSGPKERYRLEWPGKRQAMVNANLPTTKTLRPVREDSVDFDNTENLYIEGDNLEVLKILQESYLGKIKMIYIDPPYNTGKDFVYKDNFTQDSDEYKEESGQTDEYNRRLVSNPDTSGRYHSDWLSMMYPRLKLARNLLTEDGVIFMSIDDNEVDNLRKIGDEIFGEMNFISSIACITKPSGRSDDKYLATAHEYVLVFRKSPSFEMGLFDVDEKIAKRYSKTDSSKDPVRLYREEDLRKRGSHDERNDRPNLFYPFFFNENSGKLLVGANSDNTPEGFRRIEPMKNESTEGTWRWGMETAIANLHYLHPRYMKNKEQWSVFQWEYLDERSGVKPTTNWNFKDVNSERGTESFKNIGFDSKVFQNPKPLGIIKRAMKLSLGQDDLVLDFFSGSASTGHAMMEFNQEESKEANFILIQIPEQCQDQKAISRGFRFISDIGKERLKKAGEIAIENSLGKTDIGFKVYRVDESNMEDVYYQPQKLDQGNMDMFASNIKADRTSEDLLTQVLLDWGLPLTLKTEKTTIEGKEVFKVAGDSLYACFDEGLDEAFAKAVAAEKPLRLVVKDSAFTSDTAKVNVQQLLKQLSPYTELRVI